MQAASRRIAVYAALALGAAAAHGGEPDYRAMLRSHERRMEILRQGVKALPPLLAIAVDQDRGLAAEAERMARWLALRATDSPPSRQAMAKALLETADKSKEPAARKLAVALLGICGRDEAVPLLVAMLSQPELRTAARDSLVQIPGQAATKALADAFAKAKGPERGALGKALAARRDPAAVAVVATMFDDEALWQVAVESLAHTPGVGACKEMAIALDKAEPARCVALLRALGTRRSGHALRPSLKLARSGSEAERVAAIDTLGRLADPAAHDVLLEAASSNIAAIRLAALTACRRLADGLLAAGKADQAAKLLAQALPRAASDRERVAALGSLARARQPASVAVIAPLLAKGEPVVRLAAARALQAIPGAEADAAIRQALKPADPAARCILLEALAQRRVADAVPDIIALAADPHETVQVAAMQALARLPATAAEPAIAAALDKGSKPVKAAAAQACVALGTQWLAEGDKVNALAAFHRVLDAAPGRDGELAALAGLAAIASRDSAPRAEARLASKHKPLREQAAAACLAIATAMAADGHRQAATAMLKKLVAHKPPLAAAADAAIKLRAMGVQAPLPAADGIVSTWWLVGAWDADLGQWATPRFPEKEINLLKTYTIGKRQVHWRPQQADADGAVRLDPLLTPNDRAVAYAYAELLVAAPRDVVLEVASDDGCIVWLNGRKVHEHLEPRSWGTPPTKVKARLAAGANKLLLKACEGSGTWAFRLRVATPEGKPVAFKMR